MKNGPYTLIVAPIDYPGKKYRGKYAYEHHVQWWKAHGKVPKKGHEIHHKNGNHRDNRLSNLQLVTSKQHRKIHGELLKNAAIKNRPIVMCAFCLKGFTKRGSVLRSRLKRNNGRVYCGRSCQIKMQWKEGKSGIQKMCSEVP